MKPQFLQFSARVLKDINETVYPLIHDYDADKIHKLRVLLKKLRFIVKRVMYYNPESNVKKGYRPYRKIFKEVGLIRGEHVNEYRQLQSEGDEQNQLITSKKILKLYNKLSHSLQRFYLKIEDHQKVLKGQLHQITQVELKKFVDDLIAELLDSLTSKTPKRELHSNRHLLKGIIYAAEISPAISRSIKRRFDLAQIINLEDAIGDWHDLTLLLQKHKNKKGLSKKGYKNVKKLQNEKLEFVYQNISALHS